jgi:organic radical activating enzyme
MQPLMNKASVYCTAPWNGLTVRENGRVLTCCVGRRTLADLNVASVNSIETSLVLKEIQQLMLDGRPDLENCASCINQEKNDGYSSLRNHYNTFYPTIDTTGLTLKYLDLRWNNTCNLACMYCGPHFSNTWNDKLKINNLKPVKSYQNELLDWILTRASHVKEIALVGGEPLLMKQNYELLKVLPLDSQISIITNLSYDLKNLPCLPDLLKRPADKILWTVSAENTHQQFEYVRQGANWLQFEENLKFLNQRWKNTINMNMVYSMFNAFNFLEIIKVFKSFDIHKFNLLPIDGNNQLNVSFMPLPVRLEAKKILNQVIHYHRESLHPEDRDFYPIQGFESVLSHLEKGSDKTIELLDFQNRINWYNQWSKIKFQELWPNVVALTNQYLI